MHVFIPNAVRATVRVITVTMINEQLPITICGHGANDCARVLKYRYRSLALCNPNDILYIIIIYSFPTPLGLVYNIIYMYQTCTRDICCAHMHIIQHIFGVDPDRERNNNDFSARVKSENQSQITTLEKNFNLFFFLLSSSVDDFFAGRKRIPHRDHFHTTSTTETQSCYLRVGYTQL